MPIVEEYWSGILRRLQAEVQIFNRLIEHQGEKGRANELSLTQVIAKLVPGRYAVGSGVLIDSKDGSSAQTDIVIYNEADEPTILAQTTQMLFPIENTRFCIEVKTTVAKREMEDAIEKRAKMRSLSPVTGVYPAYALVGFEAELSIDTIAEHLDVPSHERLDLVLILRDGLVAGTDSTILGAGADSGNYLVGMTTAPQRVQDDLRKVLSSKSPTTVVTSIHSDEALYPIVRRRDRTSVASDPARALLLFCNGLLQWLAGADSGIAILPHYMTEEARRLERLN